MAVPPPLLSLALSPKTDADRDKLRAAVATLMAEDPTIHSSVDERSGQTIVAGIGELHLEIIVERLARQFQIEAHIGKPRVAYKETFTQPAEGKARFIRQTGGRAHFADVEIRLYPGARGSGYVFLNTISWAMPQPFVAAVDQGLRATLAGGILAGYPVDDVKVELCGGSYHDTDSSLLAFRVASEKALRDAAAHAAPVLLEPMMSVGLGVPLECAADVLADLAQRRGQLRSQVDRGHRRIIDARVPLAETLGYRMALQTLTGGRAIFELNFDGYEPRPSDLDDDWTSWVAAPRTPAPRRRDAAIALPEPDDTPGEPRQD